MTAFLCFTALHACSNGPADADQISAQDMGGLPVEKPVANAFEGAMGFGAVSEGGNGGRIIAVTTLQDSGPGSYRACVTAQFPRVCVFRVEGVIRFTGRPPRITSPYLTIAGQTAPGAGITLTHAGEPNGLTPLVIKNTHDVVVRNIRVRLDRVGASRESEDGITIENSERVMIDHVSVSGARDENINGFADNDAVSITNSIFSYGVPRHDKCALLGSDPVDAQNFSFIGNLCAHNGDRNPDVNFPPGSCVEVINNVMYNAQSEFAEVWEGAGGTPVSIIGNSFVAGPDTRENSVGIANERIASSGPAKIYIHDNEFLGDFVQIAANAAERRVASPPCSLTVVPKKSQQAMLDVLANAGAMPRDPIDRQVVSEVTSRGGRIGRWPKMLAAPTGAQAYPDDDDDGMDDRWEREHGASSSRYDPWADADGDGISNLDEFLQFRDAELAR
ncbi:pectate lyase family protein [Qipengyuania aquimaris]|uniref:pectate lyase family protein n=1 Tax=Qipengyuania aquimaris TaxID=255984 RepID=UPI001FD1C4A7|nr:pectate lyase [Qipengyuania aquimaris]UOR15181.1 pectate lyase [Qipengyuania aquimaris]